MEMLQIIMQTFPFHLLIDLIIASIFEDNKGCFNFATNNLSISCLSSFEIKAKDNELLFFNLFVKILKVNIWFPATKFSMDPHDPELFLKVVIMNLW